MPPDLMFCDEEDWPDVGDETPLKKLAVYLPYKWPGPVRLKVAFIDNPKPPAGLRGKILGHMNAWGEFCDVHFCESLTGDNPQVRITLEGPRRSSGIGTDILGKHWANKPTMRLGNLDVRNELAFGRSVRHETGHTLGFKHEHLHPEVVKRIDHNKAIEYYGRKGWGKARTRHNVLTPLPEDAILSSKLDLHSIMCYRIPKEILKPGAAEITGGDDISPHDREFAATVYPFPKYKLPVYGHDFPGASLV